MSKLKKVCSQEGFTLVELLATLALLSVVIVLAGSIHLFGQKQFSQQTDQVSQISDIRFTLSSIEKDVRQTVPSEISYDGQLRVGENVYSIEDNTLRKNGGIISDQISSFDVSLTEERIELKIKSSSEKNRPIEEISTTIYFRR
ncbi:PilW family protein [Marinilactibacillus sp. Marseille-P9653]|uniref:PilW family protein n=1 Tax=Marinilactibacillus sp. Marseille-P9653 TaxID=2866583 RepID=UPI001CE4A0CE|nr:prepilin-type N-terminal cleavage/methylation domain-containing protein [Marinilactibacillus sp. Marseille-P9653]